MTLFAGACRWAREWSGLALSGSEGYRQEDGRTERLDGSHGRYRSAEADGSGHGGSD